MDAPRPVAGDDRVLPYTRALSLFIVPFLVVAFVILYLLPGRTAHLWAWTIPVTMTSMVLASAYLGGAYFFLRVARSRRWHEVATGFLAVTVFSGLLGIATLLHWDVFIHTHVAFWLWAGLYFTAPFLVIGAWLANRRYAAPVAADDVLLGRVERLVIGGVGAGALGLGILMFLAPSSMSDLWPWPLTPLSCRVVGATSCLGGAGVASWFDPRWTSIRLMLQVEGVMLSLMLVAAVRARHELLTGRALTWPLLVGVLAMLAGSAYLWAAHDRHVMLAGAAPRRSRRPRVAGAPGRVPGGRRSGRR
jgi:hypothetical protein